jgi:aspartyl-tRNA(Asn)/glutamyl-tRNA(Gln) amidotransferase subunit B
MKNLNIEPIIGLEIHIELKTKSKMFCGCPADHFGKEPNTQTCPVCLGLPGALPVPNKKAVEWTILTGLALNCQIPKFAKFDRKNYFYPDLPKGYQISQYDHPFTINGWLRCGPEGKKGKVRIRRVHLEEDTGKLIHATVNEEKCSLIDFNRSGVPLMEIVTDPDIHFASQAKEFLERLQRIVRYLGVADADMEKGQMRCEPTVNLKISKNGEEFYTPLVEIKNINSFKFVQKAIDYEIERQFEEFQKTKVTKQSGNKTTRGWVENKQLTVLQRSKEEASDYRYFPEPDIPPFEWSKNQLAAFSSQLSKIELPDMVEKRFKEKYGLSEGQIMILTEEKSLAKYFEEAVKEGEKKKVSPQEIANIIVNKKIAYQTLSPTDFIKKIGESKTKFVLSGVEISLLVEEVLGKNQKVVEDYKKGKTQSIGFLIGQVRKKAEGKADPKEVQKVLLEKLR